MQPLPVDSVLPAMGAALRDGGAAVLVAPPGAGKSTRVPPMVLDVVPGRILMLQPRRVAARMLARRMAAERGERVGETFGWRVRFERKIGPNTRVEVLTEGLLTRRLQDDPFLEGVDCVILDEFHERSLHADLALSLLAEVRREVRPDLHIVVMSATLDPTPVARFLDAPIFETRGRAFPVEVSYDPRPDDRRLPLRVAGAVRKALQETDAGHVLGFLPGVREIEAAAAALEGLGVPVLPLHGRLSAAAQDAALEPAAPRAVILATNIAETSVTIVGVRAVVDSGRVRQPVFDGGTGVTRLLLQPISRASADQRAGRAGRTGPGWCRRLWTESEQSARPAFTVPEVQRSDLTRTALEVLGWGTTPEALRWFASPPQAALDRAMAVLERLGAVEEGQLTGMGRALLALPVDPRLARVVVAGHAAGCLRDVATAAALMGEREILAQVPDIEADSDLALRMEALRGGQRVRRRAVEEVRRVRDQLVRQARRALGTATDRPATEAELVECLRAGFPERVAHRRAPRSERFKLADGSGARLARESVVRGRAWILALDLQGGRRGTEARIRTAVALDPETLPTRAVWSTRFDPQREGVDQWIEQRYLELVVRRTRPEVPDSLAIAHTLAEAAANDPIRALQPGPAAQALLDRIAWLRAAQPDLDLADPGLEPGADSEVLRTLCHGRRSFAELRKAPLMAVLRGAIGHRALARLDRLAPTELKLPDGSSRRVEYLVGKPPVLSGRIQQFFGLAATPTIAGQPVLLHLLAPNGRPAQITSDLASFWANGYPAVRKDLRGRYPKHPWPEDPLTATPTGRAKPRR